ncbi:LTA synthase family protein [Bacteroides mediterraneensis]|uniref:LTA synthase family protein n=1 Tax=Bacteroides mediterraneensis TaxID=1841856 RepID=UPI00195D0EB6|nr:alkaline phosphatase family protein [Bacteroides mediterraneensis]MBM6780306.1 sulfatase-like hydrolase/transferase [Bacteroides mediterraneensis]
MKKRLAYLGYIFAAILGYFLLQKPIFMLYNGALEKGIPFMDYLKVLYHGFTLDAATTGYLTALPWLIILVSIWFSRFPLRKILVGYYALIALATTLVFISDMALYPFWGFKLDASIFLYLDSPKNAMASVSVGFILIRMMCILILSALLTWGLYKITPAQLPQVPQVRKRFTGSLVTILLGGILFIIIRGGVTESTSNVGQAYFCDNEFLNHSAVNPDFSLLSSISKTTDFSKQFNFFDEEKRASLFNGLYADTGENAISLLNTQRPNVLIILMESFGGVFVEPLGGLPDVSPNLNRLSKEGVFFTNCYANSFRTDRGTICTFSGYQSFPTVSVMKSPAKSRTLPSIAGKLREQGYATDFLYGGDINFTNMKSYLLSSGYQHLTADVDFTLEERKNPWGVNDDITFEHLYQQIKTRTGNQPWHTAFLTLSSHEPFEVPYHRLNEKIPNAFAFTDDCLGKFIDKLKALPQWKNLLIVCLPDHGFYYPEEGLVHDPRIHHIPMLWLGGAVKQPMVIDKLMNQSDMAATLLAQLGLSHKEFNFSRNVLGKDYKYPFAYYTYNNGFAFCDSTGVTLIDNNSDKALIESPAPNARRTELGKAILQSSYDDLGAR